MSNRPEFKQAARERLAKQRQDSKFQRGLQEYLHSERNPFNNPAIQARARIASAKAGYAHLTGGNGTGPTTPERILLDYLPGLVPNFAISLGKHKAGYPTNYKVDLAIPELKIGVEADGQTHNSSEGRERDSKKDEMLSSMGWLILRFPNKRILSQTASVVESIKRCIISRREAGTISPLGC
jgi:hypothetical protein